MGLAMEGPILVIWIWAVSGLFSMRFDGQGSSAAVPAALIGCTVLFFLPERIALFENPAAPGFAGSRVRFAILGVVGLAVLAFGLAVRRPRMWPGMRAG
jgi:hypothetical protein